MQNSSANSTPLPIALAAGLVIGFAVLASMAIAESKAIFLLAIPVVCLVALCVALNPKGIVVALLVARASLDPVLNSTRMEGEGGMGLGALFNAFVIILTAWLALKNGSRLKFAKPILKPGMIFLFVTLIAAFYSPFPSKSIRFWFNLASYFCMAILPFLIGEWNDKRFWIKVLVASSVFPVLYANYDMARGGTFFADAGQRITGTFTHPNILAFYLVLMIALVFYVLRSGVFKMKLPGKLMLMAYMGNLFVLLLATKTRNAWIACGLLFMLYGLFKERKFLVVTLLAAAIFGALPQVKERQSDLSSAPADRKNSFAWRVELWQSAMPSIGERPIQGWGLATFNDYSRSFFPMERRGVDAHNSYVQILFETGVIGLLAYLYLQLKLVRLFASRVFSRIPPLSREYAILLAYLITYLVSAFADNMFSYLVLNWYFWFLIGVMVKSTQTNETIFFRRRPVV